MFLSTGFREALSGWVNKLIARWVNKLIARNQGMASSGFFLREFCSYL
jgi:hypothetical protein